MESRTHFKITGRVLKSHTSKIYLLQTMKVFLNNLGKGLVILMVLFFSSCKLSTKELTEEVKISIVETWQKEGVTGIKIDSFMLTHKGGNEYTGLLETSEEGGKFKYNVNVTYDGENMQWQIVE